MPYKDLEKRRQAPREWVREKRKNGSSSQKGNTTFFMAQVTGEHWHFIVLWKDQLKARGKRRVAYHVRMKDGREGILETTADLQFQLHLLSVAQGDEVECVFLGNKQSKANGKPFKTYKVTVIRRNQPVFHETEAEKVPK